MNVHTAVSNVCRLKKHSEAPSPKRISTLSVSSNSILLTFLYRWFCSNGKVLNLIECWTYVQKNDSEQIVASIGIWSIVNISLDIRPLSRINLNYPHWLFAGLFLRKLGETPRIDQKSSPYKGLGSTLHSLCNDISLLLLRWKSFHSISPNINWWINVVKYGKVLLFPMLGGVVSPLPSLKRKEMHTTLFTIYQTCTRSAGRTSVLFFSLSLCQLV